MIRLDPNSSPQAKQLQIDDLLRKLDEHAQDVERIREEKDQEIAIAEEGMTSALTQLAEIHQVSEPLLNSS